jgi:DNA processing protein
LAAWLVRHGAVVVSGLAEGIDTAAHQGAIDAGGQTIGVIGTPLEKAYPAKNRALQTRLMDEYLVLSQFATGCPVQPKNFPIRNRTMALISHATIIVEAQEKSGSLHQGWEALRLGRPLFRARSADERSGSHLAEKTR